MIYLISPAKTMKSNHNNLPINILFKKQSLQVAQSLKTLTQADIKTLMKVSDKVSEYSYDLYQNLSYEYGSKANVLYDGMQYKAIAYEKQSLEVQRYMDEHILVVSALYGLVRFYDIIENYRLEMMCKLTISDQGLSEYWSEYISEYLLSRNEIIVDLCSKEYRKPYEKKVNTIEIVFKSKTSKDPIKKLRGMFLNCCCMNKIETLEQLKAIAVLNYRYDEHLSSEYQYVYVKES